MTRLDASILYCDEAIEDETWIEPGLCSQDVFEFVHDGAADLVDPGYLCAEIRPQMRSVLFDWMQQVCQEYALCRETFHLAITYVDRYLSFKGDVLPARLQLVGVTSLLLAAKLEEVNPPTVDEFAATCAGCCTVCDILGMEKDVAFSLGWSLRYSSAPTWVALYLQRAIHQHDADDPVRKDLLNADQYMRVMEIIDYGRLFVTSLEYAPSALAAASIFYVYRGLATPLERCLGVNVADIESCLTWLSAIAERLPFVGLRPILRGCRTDPQHLYSRQVYHPMALDVCLNTCR